MFICLLVAGVLAAGVTTVLDRLDDDDPLDTGSATTTTSTVATTTTVAPVTTSSPEPADTTDPTSTSAPPTTPTTVVATTTAPPPATTGPSFSFPRCSDEHIVVTIGTNKALYVVGEAVRATAVVRMVSPEPCYLPNENITWRDAGGVVLCCLVPPETCRQACPPNFFPGQVITLTPCWDQRTTNGAPVGTGTYAAFHRGLSASFEVVLPAPEAPQPSSC